MRLRRIPVLVLALAAALATAASGEPAEARIRAVLVGVSGYPGLDPQYRLSGPANDVRELARLLIDAGAAPADVTVLADGATALPGGIATADPTRAAILAALDALATNAEPGDLAVFYFSGHGSQQRDTDGDEGGGADEIFLPYDVAKWTRTSPVGTVENAVVDDELWTYKLRILNAGADFWGIIDACHSSTGFRAVTDGRSRSRFVDPAVLGLPDSPDAQDDGASPPAAPDDALAEKAGAFVEFYAAQQYQQAQERPFGPGADDNWHGVFTFNLLRHLRQGLPVSYGQLFQAVTDDVSRDPIALQQRPNAVGTMLERPVLGREAAETAVANWRIKEGKLDAGLLDGVTAGSIVALYETAIAPDEAAIGHAQVRGLDTLEADLAAIHYPCAERDAAGACPALSAGLPGGAAYARLVEPGVDFSLRVSEPALIDPGDTNDHRHIEAALATLAGLPAEQRGGITFGAADYDVALALAGGKLVVSDLSGVVDPRGPGSSIRIDVPHDPAEAEQLLLENFRRMARVAALIGATGAAGSKGLTLGLPKKAIEVALIRDPQAPAADTCSGRPPLLAEGTPVLPETVFRHCDAMTLRVVNRSITPHDVTILYVDGTFGISPMWPPTGRSNRRDTNEEVALALRIETREQDGTPKATGEERIIVLAVPVEDGQLAEVVLTGLAQPGLRTRGDDAATLQYLTRAVDPETRTRGDFKGFAKVRLVSEVKRFFVAPD